jgi:hypothetical protein
MRLISISKLGRHQGRKRVTIFFQHDTQIAVRLENRLEKL